MLSMRSPAPPVLANETGGISGPALKPIALRCVYDIASAVSVPIIGTGGVLSGVDAVEMIFAGRHGSRGGVGGLLPREGGFSLIRDELSAWLPEHGCSTVGAASRESASAQAERLS